MVLKPTKRGTLHRLQVALVTAMAGVRRPESGTAIDWLSPCLSLVSFNHLDLLIVFASTHSKPQTTPTARYVQLTRSLYALGNSTASLPVVSAHIIRTLVSSLGDDVLKFLTGIWLDDTSADTTRYAALRHAAAYLEAHFSTQRFVDFQVIVPALLVAMSDGDRRVRDAAVEVVTVLLRLSQAQKPVSVYGFDVIYGSASGKKSFPYQHLVIH